MEPRSFKKLAPAPAKPGNESPVAAPTQGSRRSITRNACSPCKNKKAKYAKSRNPMLKAQCDGNRPECGRCQKKGGTCLYEVNRRDIAKLQLMSDSDAARLQSLDMIFAVLQHGTDEETAELLAQIRLGGPAETLASASGLRSFHHPTSVPYETSAVLPNSGPSITCEDPDHPSAARTPHGFLDLLGRDDWSQSAETSTSYSNQIPEGESGDFLNDSIHSRLRKA
ncbi:uncharacterized protein F4807DRAFT_456252 [Annulohypoxylon truncatum]|uniref:uncharacterized protein n=1 Tax=Annulohypoxylon truncatum TaxID=327061 RepID=UPI0020080A0D|nr:uncharacterized protein F4807DRAFT_456252 [Annulohypoxylon truncatum]KAI1213705.1 hypothetical protein F4807DRAFT_456252 [Annulohypoxylon truncatum]